MRYHLRLHYNKGEAGMAKMVDIRCPNGAAADGYLATAANPVGALVALQEWWGLNDQMREVANRFADSGYTTLVPDLYQGRVTQDPDEAGHLMEGLDWVGATEQEVAGAVALLKASHAKVAVMGFCMGGALTVIAGVNLADIDACVCYYGIPPREQADPARLAVPFQGHFANDDDWCTPSAVDELERQMTGLSLPWEVHRYDAKHGFFNHHEAKVYDEAACQLSMERTLAFLSDHLR